MEKLTTTKFNQLFDLLNSKNLSSTPTIIDFYADWCGPCKVMGQTLESIVPEYEHINFYKINIDEEHEISEQFKIRSIPTLLFIKSDGKFTLKTGSIPASILKEFIQLFL